jgi:hypothetical protein
MAPAVDTLEINSGNAVLDKKIEEWLQWDKVGTFLLLSLI